LIRGSTDLELTALIFLFYAFAKCYKKGINFKLVKYVKYPFSGIDEPIPFLIFV